MKKLTVFVLVFVVLVSGIGYLFRGDIVRLFSPSRGSTAEPAVSSTESEGQDIEVVAENLDIPWEIAFLPGGDMLITERPGILRRIGASEMATNVEGVEHIGEGGLMGLALHPDFPNNQLLYLYLTSRTAGRLENRVERFRLEETGLTDRTVIISGIPGAPFHNGGRIAFGPDGYLYVTTGEPGDGEAAQDIGSLAGKILRVADDGRVPPDNPFGNAVYSYGHRNPQGLAWDSEGRLWATDHGRSGLRSGLDELNLIERGANYGWPEIQGDETREGMRSPVINSGPDETWAPAAMVFSEGRLLFCGLRGQALYEAQVTGEGTVSLLRAHLREDFGRLRAVVVGPDGYLYVSTSNTDGRGSVRPGDDKILRINPLRLR